MFVLYCFVTISIVAAYVYLIIYLLEKWSEIPSISYSDDASLAIPTVSFVIPARNESQHIKRCIDGVLMQSDKHPDAVKEVIIVDDHSVDDTAVIVKSIAHPKLQLIPLEDHLDDSQSYNAYKKIALNLGITHATGDYIIQMDADTYCGPDYLEAVLGILSRSKADMIAAPVVFDGDGSAFQNFQILDILGMMALTAVGIETGHWHLSNGANLIYRRGLVQFRDSAWASGDDIFAIQKVAADNDSKILYLKDLNAIVKTPVETSIPNFVSQRLRWATKNKNLKGKGMWIIMAIPYIMVIWLLVHILAYIIFGPISIVMALMHFSAKVGIDYLYLKEVTNYFEAEEAMSSFWYSALAHTAYIAIIGTMSLFVRKYEWKGRRVS